MTRLTLIAPGQEPVETTLEEMTRAAERMTEPVGKYRLAPEVEAIARRLIPEHHKHLATAHIAYIMAESLPARNGKTPMAKAQKASEAQNLLHGYDFVITVNKKAWDMLTPQQCEALVDHELAHCGLGENGWTIWAHDVEEFAAVIKRHGLWHEGARVFAKAVEQMEFDLVGAAR
ncbi:MAG TPA: hypothetical protein GX513_12925 [Firmicutes bacterium]|nr:hypothetical protein [Bacillota bacterium]